MKSSPKRRIPSGESPSEEHAINEDMPTEVAFFLGAGASVAAGVPHTFGFVEEFIGSLSERQREFVQCIKAILEKWGLNQNPVRLVDIELLLESLQRLANKEQDLLLPFFEENKLRLPKDFDANSLLKDLRNFIKSKVIVEVQAINYLGPLRGFIQEFHPLDIYSANYDTCIELFCTENKLVYRDGFDEAWNPKVFNDPDTDVRLFKIHGSIMWYGSDRGRYLKIPVMFTKDDSSIELLTRERVQHLMLYPAQKYEYVEPLFELLLEMKHRLLFCKTLFVIGYSFRDDHIRRIFWDIARSNREFHIVLISPNAWEIYQTRLKTYDGVIASSLEGRVICLPYLFEKVLSALKNEIFNSIRSSRASAEKRKQAEISGSNIDWSEGLLQAARGGDNEVLYQILEKLSQVYKEGVIKRTYLNNEQIFESAFLGIIHAAGNNDNNMIPHFWGKIREVILSIIGDLKVDVNPLASRLYINLMSGGSIATVVILINKVQNLIIARQQWMKEPQALAFLTDILSDLGQV
ncbi:SIR2 family protein [Candidatus Manganitrophus noduliformans]|uniref:SIR2-like domain-containing protein n=1 Tax=Candidatus Manganitrophus noduliformans TaxID=2606439 RepID=A0A7X6DN75_9BACT|nr:SIR2 family protein [Candidatus Manganitrophus noduliformans]NKE70351.1 hypothetical protein [Candidatus Manganitrophus noduliformans]